MKILQIDDKWSVRYDPANNDRPVTLLRHDRPSGHGVNLWSNDQTAMFYALLEARGEQGTSGNPAPKVSADTAAVLAGAYVKEPAFVAAFLNALASKVHADNVAAGWWTDPTTGEDLLFRRNVPEMLMLIVSEIAEAMEGQRKNLMDDKLPHRPMLQTELADAIIRILDLAGSRARIDDQLKEPVVHGIGDIIEEKRAFNRTRPDHKLENRLKAGGKMF